MRVLRAIAGVILGYVTMFIVVFVCFSVAWTVLKANGSFKAGTWETSLTWCLSGIVIGLVAAILGGVVCAALAVGRIAPRVLAGLVLVLGALAVIPALSPPEDVPERTSDVSMFEAMQYARKPVWSAIADPIIGFAGVLIGASLVRKKNAAAPPAE